MRGRNPSSVSKDGLSKEYLPKTLMCSYRSSDSKIAPLMFFNEATSLICSLSGKKIYVSIGQQACAATNFACANHEPVAFGGRFQIPCGLQQGRRFHQLMGFSDDEIFAIMFGLFFLDTDTITNGQIQLLSMTITAIFAMTAKRDRESGDNGTESVSKQS